MQDNVNTNVRNAFNMVIKKAIFIQRHIHMNSIYSCSNYNTVKAMSVSDASVSCTKLPSATVTLEERDVHPKRGWSPMDSTAINPLASNDVRLSHPKRKECPIDLSAVHPLASNDVRLSHP